MKTFLLLILIFTGQECKGEFSLLFFFSPVTLKSCRQGPLLVKSCSDFFFFLQNSKETLAVVFQVKLPAAYSPKT